ncbi:hypothetical protein V6N13_088338 [Hibiscus sabdariffa]
MFLSVFLPFSNTMKSRQPFFISIVWFSLILHVFVPVSSQHLAVDCGSKGGKDEDGRNWEPDEKYLKKSDGSTQLQAGNQDPSLLSIIPYMNARIFTSPAKYEFPIKSKQRYLLRFHFYPSAYPNFNISNSYFSVTAGEVTLMKNFSAEITYVTAVMGFGSSDIDVSSENLQTMLRLNVGGQAIPPGKDSGGLLRSWYDDDPYILGAAIGISTEANKDVRIDYKKVNQRKFNIYINNQSAQTDPDPADIIEWTGGKGVPTYKDYVIVVGDGPDDEMVRIEMSPSLEYKSWFADSQLNGVEIFKLNDENKNLAGKNPQLSSMLLKMGSEPEKSFVSRSNNTVVIAGAAGGSAAAFLVVALVVLAYRKRKPSGVDSHTSSWQPVHGNSHTTGESTSNHALALAQGLSRHFSISEIRQATKNFDDSNVIGVGGSAVHKVRFISY